MKKPFTELSRVLSHALRHDPGRYGLELDPEGWVGLGEVVAALRSRPGWESVGVADIEEPLAAASKQRHEIRDGRIRAIYGHSLPERIERTPTTPPDLLYHGTSPDNLERVMREGLLPMSRKFVHLSTDAGMAWAVGRGTRRARSSCTSTPQRPTPPASPSTRATTRCGWPTRCRLDS